MLKTISGTFASKFTLAILNFATIIISTRLLGAAGRGEISFFVTNMVLILLFTNIVGGSSLVYITPRSNFFKCLIPIYVWAFCITLLFCFVFLYYNQVYASDFYFLFLATLFNSFKSANMMVLLGKEKLKEFNWLALLHSVFLIALFLLFFYPGNLVKVESFYWAVLIANVIVWLLSTLLLFNLGESFDVSLDKKILHQLISIGGLAQLANIIQFANYRISYYYLMNSNANGAAELGKYSIAVSIAESVWIVGQSLATVQFSRLSNVSDPLERRKISVRLFKLNFILNFVAVVVLLCIPASLYAWVFGAGGFDLVRSHIFWMSLGIFALGVSTSTSAYFAGRGMYKPAVFSSLWGVLFTVIICQSYINTYGVTAAAIATSVSYTAICMYFLFRFLKTENLQLFNLIPGFQDVKLYTRWVHSKL